MRAAKQSKIKIDGKILTIPKGDNEIWCYCNVFKKVVPLGLCYEVSCVIEGDFGPDFVPELHDWMKKSKLSLEQIKKLHAEGKCKRLSPLLRAKAPPPPRNL
jgi:hypothetical protein